MRAPRSGLDEALRRARLYEQAGADVIFVESPESEAELERDRPARSRSRLLANMVEFGKTSAGRGRQG